MDQPQACMVAADAVPRTKHSNYPEPFASRMTGREKKPLGDPFGLSQFGVNLTTLSPGAVSALHHRHSKQDEWVYVLSGEVTLYVGDESYLMRPGMYAGFRANGMAHHLQNNSAADATIIEVGSRVSGDAVSYATDDLVAVMSSNGQWGFQHKNGEPY
ncbi:cupin domain-containing protein [Burkholderia sp. KCJ3K979]|uniref:cupin domain-containing protein n=1 Tax=Burkholderia TaxID=32008 RepID=UPI001929B31E|nr:MULTISPECIES: cupin domain-containing protein [Burkholderia]MBL3963746.1 cupin domain-containing protein [Burkholderia sp. KCJ3K979]MDR8074956.1 cupin domain-containing protein [Burkholderia cenocepacia]